MSMLELSTPTRPWRAAFRGGLAVLAVALAAAAFVTELDLAASQPLAALLPIAGVALGVVLLVRALPRLARDGRVRRLAADVRDALPIEFAVLAGYLPRDAGDGEIDLVIVGPTGVFAVAVCETSGTLACHEDIWYRQHAPSTWRLTQSPSRRARRDAARLRADVASGGFVRTAVEPVVLFRYAHLTEVAGCSAVDCQGIEALVDRVRRWNRAPLSDQRARAIARSLSGTLGLAS